MKAIDAITTKLLQVPEMTRVRMWTAYGVAASVDAAQWILGPLGWLFADELLDVAAMLAISRAIGFHPLLLPTFVLEFVPLADLLPTWTGCVALVIALRRQHRSSPPSPGPGSVIDV
jgi:hypothetical protein